MTTTYNSKGCLPGLPQSFALLDSSAFGLLCAPASTPHRLAVRRLDMLLALEYLRPCPWLGASKSGSCKAMMTGEVECKGGPTLV